MTDAYDVKDLHEHILLGPDTYVGSLEPSNDTCCVLNDNGDRLKNVCNNEDER